MFATLHPLSLLALFRTWQGHRPSHQRYVGMVPGPIKQPYHSVTKDSSDCILVQRTIFTPYANLQAQWPTKFSSVSTTSTISRVYPSKPHSYYPDLSMTRSQAILQTLPGISTIASNRPNCLMPSQKPIIFKYHGNDPL